LGEILREKLYYPLYVARQKILLDRGGTPVDEVRTRFVKDRTIRGFYQYFDILGGTLHDAVMEESMVIQLIDLQTCRNDIVERVIKALRS